MGFSICIRHINCRVGLPHKISMYWNKLLMYQNMNTYIHFWSFKRNHFPLSIFSFFFFFFSFYTSGDGTVFQSVNENYVTTVSQKKFLIRLSAIGLCDSFLLGNNTISYQGKKKIEGLEETYFRVVFKKHDMGDRLYAAVGGREEHYTLFAFCFSAVQRMPKLVTVEWEVL